MLTLGVIANSRKENEHRLPLHPDHFELVPQESRGAIRFECGYGEPFGISDGELKRRFGGTADRSELLQESQVVLLPKPLPEDLRELRENGILWGWPHCVQQREITQIAIDRKLTLIAWEAMFSWNRSVREMHVFDRNNEMAGYCGVIHALGLTGKDGLYGAPAEACVISHGSVSRGAIYALQRRGFRNIRVYTQREPWAVHDKIPGCRYGQMLRGGTGDGVGVVQDDGSRAELIDVLGAADVIVNGVLQDTDRPLMFLRESEETRLKPGALIVDVSCDRAMGFPFARPTSFEAPTFTVGRVTYYGVDHTPSYLWQSASWEISRVVVPFVTTVLGGPAAWDRNETIRRAIEIREGVVCNETILSFQNRETDYPHRIVSA
jgi:alanine dehydrogenase